MYNLRQVLTLVLSFSLLGQSAVFAAGQSSGQPQTLAQYQQRAKEDIKRAPWIAREGKYILGIGGAAVTLLAVQQVMHQRKTNMLRDQYAEALQAAQKRAQQDLLAAQKTHYRDIWNVLQQADAREEALRSQIAAERQKQMQLQKEIQTLQATNQGLTDKIVSVQNELKRSQNINQGLRTGLEVRRNKLIAAQQAAEAREMALLAELEALQKRFNMKKSHYTDLVHYSTSLDKELMVYEKLFDKALPEAERKALREQLAREPWLLQATKAQQDEFLTIIDQASDYRRGTYREAGDGFMRYLIRRAIDKNMPLYERLIGMCRHIFHSKNLMTVAVLVTLGMSAHDAKAQKMADRINTNFDLFLNATPQQLTEIGKNEEAKKVCIQGAEALHQMSLMNQEEASFLLQGLDSANTKAGRRGTVNLAR